VVISEMSNSRIIEVIKMTMSEKKKAAQLGTARPKDNLNIE
jgi:hypothetical protein